jgi:hypothetical protein
MGDPLPVVSGPHLFYAVINIPGGMALVQQFWSDIELNIWTGDWIALMTDADPATGVDKSTSDPKELVMDTGSTGIEFSVIGAIVRSDAGGLEFSSQPFDVNLVIGPIVFKLNGAVISGSILLDAAAGLSRWDGQLAMESMYYSSGSQEGTYTAEDGLEPSDFEIVELKTDDVPPGLPRVCDDQPCVTGIQSCTLNPSVTWPPAEMCDD